MKYTYIKELKPVVAILDCSAYEGGYMIHRINVPKRHRRFGHGTALLQEAITDADTEGAKLYLGLSPSDGMDFDELECWYKKHGFVELEDGMYIREPNRGNINV